MINWLYIALQAIINGLLTGALYAIIGMGMALIFGVMRIVNFAHGAFLMMGMYATYVVFQATGVSPYYQFPLAGILLFFVGYATYMGLLRPIRGQVDFMVILLTMGLALILIDGAQLVFGADYHQINIPLLSKKHSHRSADLHQRTLAGSFCHRGRARLRPLLGSDTNYVRTRRPRHRPEPLRGTSDGN